MKNIKWILTTFILFTTLSAFSQDSKTLKAKVSDILAEMPTGNAAHRDQLMEQVLAFGGEGISAFTTLLTPPGEGDDTQARYMLESLAKYVTQKGKEQHRSTFSKALATELEQAANEEIKAFLIRRLQFTAQDNEVLSLKQFIGDDYLSEAAIRALVSIGSPTAEKALVDALGQTSGAQQIAVVKALGQLNSTAATDKIMMLASGNDASLKKVSLYTLANTADPKVFSLLSDAAQKAAYQYEPSEATDAFLSYGENLLLKNQEKWSSKVALIALKNATQPQHAAVRSKAVSLLVSSKPQKATKILLKELRHEDPAYRNSLLMLAKDISGEKVNAQWLKKLKKSSDPVKAEIISMLTKRGDPSVLPALRPYLKASDDDVKIAALKAVTKFDKENAIDLTLAFIQQNDEQAAAGKKILASAAGFEDLGKLTNKLEASGKNGQKALIEVIASKRGIPHFDAIYPYTEEKTAVGSAARSALKNISTSGSIDQLLALLTKFDDKKDILPIQDALAVAINDIDDEKERYKRTLDILSKVKDKASVLEITPRIGGYPILKTVVGEFQNGKAKNAAFSALSNWKGAEVAPELFDILNDQASGQYRKQAFKGYVEAAKTKSIPDDQKLLMLRKALPHAKTLAEKISIIRSMGNVRTFLSFMHVAQFLDDKNLQQAAASAAMNIALPKPGEKQGLYGENIRQALLKVIEVMDGPDSQYYKIDVKNYLEQMPEDKGYVSMFNGKDLSGWQGFVTNPIKKAAMETEELAKKQAEANNTMSENWAVKDGSIVFSGKGHNLVSIKEYGDFEMIVDWRITKGGDSGIYLRGTPQVQIWDTARVDVGAQVGSGGLYNNQKNERIPLVLADNAIGDWNTFRIKMIGEKVTIYLNGQLVVDEVPLENYWDRSQAIFPAGPIELQAHGSDLAFRDIYVREMASPDFGLTSEEKLDGFQSLFNGKNLDGWIGNKKAYQALDGNIIIDPKQGGGGNLFTEEEYSSFVFRFEFQLTPGANNGLGIHAPLKGDAAYAGKEIQILDNTAKKYAKLNKYQFHGSVYGIIPAKRGYLNPVGEWNKEEVIVQGSKIKVILNGTTIVDGDMLEASKNGPMDGRNHPGLKRSTGHIGFLGHGSVLKFRNIRIKKLE